jgi:xylulokinase
LFWAVCAAEPGMSFLGVDIGTSGCKAAVFDTQGCLVASAQRRYPLHTTGDGGAELDSTEVLNHCLAAIAEAAHQAGRGRVKAIGISSQGEAFTPVDRHGHPLARAMVSSDVRATALAQSWPQDFGVDRLYQITGHTGHPLFSLFKLLWLKEHRPEVWQAAARFLCFEDLLQLRLGLEPAMGWPLAGRTMLFDVRRHEWSSEILDRIGLSPERLARPLASGTVAGTIASAMAGDLALAKGAVVVTGGHDQPCGGLGAGATEPGAAMYATGTVECITPTFARPVFTPTLRRYNLCTYDHAVPGRYTTVAYSLTGGNLLEWYRDQFAPGQDYEAILKTAAPKPTRLLVLPYWTASGTPYFDLRTPGAILGLRLTTTRGEILRALLEGVALEMRLNLEVLRESGCEIRELRAIGGGAKSAFWTQLKADVLGRPITPLNVAEAGCLGVAMLACAATTGQALPDLARGWIKPQSAVLPRDAGDYEERFALYRELYPALQRIRL